MIPIICLAGTGFFFSFGYLKKNPVLMLFSGLVTLGIVFSVELPDFLIMIIIAFAGYEFLLSSFYFMDMR